MMNKLLIIIAVLILTGCGVRCDLPSGDVVHISPDYNDRPSANVCSDLLKELED